MSFILRAASAYFNNELGFGLAALEEKDMLKEGILSEVLANSSELEADLLSGDIVRLDAFGGSVIPPALAFDDQSVASHQADVSAHGLTISVLAQVNDAGSGQIIGTVERTKLSDIQANAEVNDTGSEILTKLQAESAPLALNVAELQGATSAQIRDRATHTGTQLASSVSDFDASADARIAAQKATSNGIASLDGAGQVPFSQLGNLPPTFTPKGNWDAATNTPALASGIGTVGDMYLVNVAGSTSLDGISDWAVGDQAYFAAGAWQKSDNTDAVTSVAGKIGAVLLDTDDVSEATALYFTDARVTASPAVVLNSAKVSADGPVSTHSDVNTTGATQGQALLLNAGVWEPGDLAGESPQPVVQARRSANFSLSSGVWVPIPFDVQDEETDAASLSNPAGQLDRIVILDNSAPVELVAWIPWDATTNDAFSIRIRKNDSIIVPGSEADIITFDDFTPVCVVVKVPRSFITSGDYCRVEMNETAGDVQVLTGATFQATQLKGVKGEKGDPGSGTTIGIEKDGSPVTTASVIDFGRGIEAEDGGGGKALIRAKAEYVYLGKTVDQQFTTSISILFDDVIKSAATDFSISTVSGGTRIECLFDGEIEATYDANIGCVSNNRETSRAVLQKNGVDVPHSDRFGYHRNNANGNDSMTLSALPLAVVTGDYFEVQANVATPAGTLEALANGCIFKLKRI